MKTKALNLTILALLATASLTFISCSSTPPPPPEETSSTAYQAGVPGGVMVNTVKVSARVTAIDQAKRTATLMGADGKKFPVQVGPEAVNFDQVKVGDQVNATITEELVVYLGDKGTPSGDTASAVVLLAPKGGQPGGVAAETTQITGTVTAIDLKHRTATLRFEDGSTKTFPVRSDVDLSRRKVGDQVVFRMTTMVAIALEKP